VAPLHVIAVDPELQAGAALAVVLEDGVGTRCVYVLRDVAAPPRELRLPRPADVPALLATRDPASVYFAHTGERVGAADRLLRGHDVAPADLALGLPLYRQVVRD
jgi:hypothetical protein